VSSPVRAFRGVGGEPPVIASAKGATLIDVDGRRYVDLIGAWGPMILGHGHPAVLRAIQRRAARSVATGTPSPDEVALGRAITRRLPGVERLRFVVSGTEACMAALRLARAATGRTALIKFEGCYHGHADPFLASAGSGALTFGTPDSPGVPADVVKHTLTVPYNDLAAVARAFTSHPAQVAAVIVEPVVGNMGLVLPEPGFLPGLRSLCDRHGALLIFDEVMTGFRVGLGGAQALYGVRPDLTTLGKVIGGGLPVAAYGGRRDLLARVAPEGPVYQAGTLAGNPVAMAAGLATLSVLTRRGVFARIARQTRLLAEGLERVAREEGDVLVAPYAGAMLGLWFAPRPSDKLRAFGPPRNLTEAKATDLERFRRYHGAMLAHGVHLPPSPYEAWFVSLAHDARVIATILTAHRAALRATR
jgi:glutamate-1-semialdehyde 2,1-aminomutase